MPPRSFVVRGFAVSLFLLLEIIKLHPTVFLALLSAVLLTQCGEASNIRCGEASIPRNACSADAACIWAVGACLPKCESDDDCSDAELCDSHLVYTLNTEFLAADVCFPTALLQPPQNDAELEERERQCRARDLQGCERDSRCQWEYAEKLNLEAQCREPTPVGCKAPLTLCTLSIVVAEDSHGDLFIFAMGCGNDSYTPLHLDFDTPLYELLFGGETEVYDWPRCS